MTLQPKDHAEFPVLVKNSIMEVENLMQSLQKMEESLCKGSRKRVCRRRDDNESVPLQLVSEAKGEVESFKKKSKKVLQIKQFSEKLDTKKPNVKRSLERKSFAVKQEEESWSEHSSDASSQEKNFPKRKQRRTKTDKKANNGTRGGYMTVSPEIRSNIHRILHEQAQIWYDMYHNPHIDYIERVQRGRDLITNNAALKSSRTENLAYSKTTTQPSGKDSLKSLDDCAYSPFTKSIYQDFHSHQNFQDPDIFLNKYSAIEENHLLEPKPLDLNSFMCLKFENDEHQQEESPEIKSNLKDRKKFRKVFDIPIKPLGQKMFPTIPREDILKYLKENELKIVEENKKTNGDTQVSIIKAVSKLTGINEKTIRRIACSGPARKKGGGRKRLDSDMENHLTEYIVELNKRGRPPTRGEVKILGQLLSNVPGFRASKGWLDKYLNRVKEQMESGTPGLKEFFKIISYTDLKKVEFGKTIVSCLEEIGAPENMIEKFKNMNYEKSSDLLAEKNSEDLDAESQKEPLTIKKSPYVEENMIEYPQDEQETVFLEDDKVVLPNTVSLTSPWRDLLKGMKC